MSSSTAVVRFKPLAEKCQRIRGDRGSAGLDVVRLETHQVTLGIHTLVSRAVAKQLRIHLSLLTTTAL